MLLFLFVVIVSSTYVSCLPLADCTANASNTSCCDDRFLLLFIIPVVIPVFIILVLVCFNRDKIACCVKVAETPTPAEPIKSDTSVELDTLSLED